VGFLRFMKTKKALKIGQKLINDLDQIFRELGGWESVEIFVQNNKITQITSRKIKKTNHSIK